VEKEKEKEKEKEAEKENEKVIEKGDAFINARYASTFQEQYLQEDHAERVPHSSCFIYE